MGFRLCQDGEMNKVQKNSSARFLPAYFRTAVLTLLALCAFAGNSLLCRAALTNTTIDAASFTSIRLAAGALLLWLMLKWQASNKEEKNQAKNEGSWLSGLALFGYAICFSLAYRQLNAATGALILFAAVQITMIGTGLWRGEKLRVVQATGFGISCIGLVGLLLPGLSAPPLLQALTMLCAGVAWGVYSLRGKFVTNATQATANNFIRAVAFAAVLSLFMIQKINLDAQGSILAIISGAITSGLGYAIWYKVLPELQSTTAASLQLSVPVITALGGILFLSEPLTLRLIIASAAILGGIALVIWKKSNP